MPLLGNKGKRRGFAYITVPEDYMVSSLIGES